MCLRRHTPFIYFTLFCPIIQEFSRIFSKFVVLHFWGLFFCKKSYNLTIKTNANGKNQAVALNVEGRTRRLFACGKAFNKRAGDRGIFEERFLDGRFVDFFEKNSKKMRKVLQLYFVCDIIIGNSGMLSSFWGRRLQPLSRISRSSFGSAVCERL